MATERMTKPKHYVCFFQSEHEKHLFGVILGWYPDGAYSLVGCESMRDALIQFAKDSAFYEQHGWIVTGNCCS
jgi:hypothetical protein